jgi:hypothetical protein
MGMNGWMNVNTIDNEERIYKKQRKEEKKQKRDKRS